MGRLSLCLGILVIATGLLIPRIYHFVRNQNYGKIVYNHQPGECVTVKGIEHGSEDIQALPNGIAFITSGLRFNVDQTKSPWRERKGQILKFDFNKPDEGATAMTIEGDFDSDSMNVHGLSIWQDEGGISMLVVNHQPDAEVVERFSYDPERPAVLKHEESFMHQNIIFPNDIVAVGHREFYFTNYLYHFGHDNWMMTIERTGMFAWGSVGFFDGRSARLVVQGLITPNGINRSKNSRLIYVAHPGEQSMHVYERQEDNSLVLKQDYYVGTAADNIDVDPETGDLWLGCHPIRWRVRSLATKPGFLRPSQVLRLKTEDGLITESIEVYSEDGSKFLSGTSVAVRYKDMMFAGTVIHKAVLCRLAYQQ